MALDFPASPINGQAYGSYIYNATVGAWQSKEDPATVAVTSTTAPASANNGDIWYNTNTGVSYIYYNDGTSAQWVEVISSAVPSLNSKANITYVDQQDLLKSNLSGGNSFTGSQLLFSNATSQVPLTINGYSGQSANLQEWKTFAGTLAASINSSGVLTINGSSMSSELNSNGLAFSRANATYITNTEIGGYLIHSGTTTTSGDTRIWSSSVNSGFILNPVSQMNASKVPLTIKGSASQSANLQEWHNNSSAVLSSINSAGNLTIPKIGLGGQSPNAAFFMDATGRAKLRSNGAESSGMWLTDSAGTESAFLGMGGTSSSDALGVWHNSAWRLQVDNLGRVAMPYQPAFYSAGSGTFVLSGVQQDYLLPFTTVDLNRGNCFNSSNYRFTAPVAGVYYFWMQSCTTDATSTGPEIYIIKNGSAYNNVAISYNSAYYNTFGAGYVINLNANDYVQMAVRNNNGTTFTIERGRSRFAGYLMG